MPGGLGGAADRPAGGRAGGGADGRLRQGHRSLTGIGHNGGPPLEEPDPGGGRLWLWTRARKRAWSVKREVALSRLARAEALGVSYREYTLEIMERGRYL